MALDKRKRKLPKGIRQRSSTFEGRFMYKGESYTVHGDTVTETQKKMTELKYKLERGIFVEKSKMTFDEWFETWIEQYKKNTVKVGTYISYNDYYRYYLKDTLGPKNIADIRGEHIQKLYNDMAEDHEQASIKVVAAVLSGCFRQAVKNRIIEHNPVVLAEIPRKSEKNVKQAMTKEQQALFMEYAKDSYLYYLFAVMLRTGLRSGEIRGLIYAKDVDKKAKVLHVQRTLKYENLKNYDKLQKKNVKAEFTDAKGATFFVDTPKTATSIRDIPLTEDLEKLLDLQRKYWGFKVEKIDRFLFCNEKGEPLRGERIRTEIERIVKLIEEDGHEFPHITPHTFRHTFATRAIEAGMQPQVLKTILGHSTLAMTMDLYSHVLPDTKAEEMEKIANVF